MPRQASHSAMYGKKKRKKVFYGKPKKDSQDDQVSKFQQVELVVPENQPTGQNCNLGVAYYMSLSM